MSMKHRVDLTLRERKLLLRARRGRQLPRWIKPVGLIGSAVVVLGGLGQVLTGETQAGGMAVGFGGMMAVFFLGHEEIQELLNLVRKLDAAGDEPDAEG